MLVSASSGSKKPPYMTRIHSNDNKLLEKPGKEYTNQGMWVAMIVDDEIMPAVGQDRVD